VVTTLVEVPAPRTLVESQGALALDLMVGKLLQEHHQHHVHLLSDQVPEPQGEGLETRSGTRAR
jgi:hypothetical protein